MSKSTSKNSARNAIFEVFKARKLVFESLLFKEQNISLKDVNGTNKKEIDASIWNEMGLYFLNNRMYSDALMIYEHMLQTILKVESQKVLPFTRVYHYITLVLLK